MKRLVLLLAALLVLPVVADAQKRCVKGKPCGNTCIARNRTCRVGTPPAASPRPQARSLGAVTPAEPGDSLRWVASSRGQVYYKRGCSNANQLAAAKRIYFRTEEEARRAGYRRSVSRGC